jgi:hypothetical protein
MKAIYREVFSMIAKNVPGIPLQGATLPNRVLIPVSWDEADRLGTRLREQGIEVTACFDAAERTAGLELPPGADAAAVQKLLGEQLRGNAAPQ